MRNEERVTLVIKLLLPVFLAVLLNLSPQAAVLHDALSRAQVAVAYEQHAVAAEHLQQAAAYQPWRGDLWEQLGEQRMLAEQYVGAAEAYQRAWMLDEISDAGLAQWAQAHLALEEDGGAIRAWQARIDRGGAAREVYASLAAAQRRQGKIADAAATLCAWLEQDPEDADTAYELGVHLMVSAPDEAVEMLDLAAELAPGRKVQTDMLSDAVEAALEEEDAAYRLMLIGRALGRVGEWDLAKMAFDDVVVLTPEYAEGWAMLGEAQQQLGQDGLQALEEAQALAPDSVLVRSVRALYWRRLGQPEVALPIYTTLAKEEPDKAIWQAEIAHALSEMGDILSALPYYQSAAEMAGTDPLYWEELARFSIGNGIEARNVGLPAARMVLLLRPDDPAALDLMGWTMLYFHDWPSAERFLQQAIQLDEDFAPAHLHLGQVYIQMAQHQEARRHLIQAVSLDGEGFDGVMAQRLLDSLP